MGELSQRQATQLSKLNWPSTGISRYNPIIGYIQKFGKYYVKNILKLSHLLARRSFTTSKAELNLY